MQQSSRLRPPTVDELVHNVELRAGISTAQASLAVTAMLAYFGARLPSPVVGHIHQLLIQGASAAPSTTEGDRP